MNKWLSNKDYIVTGSIAEGHPVGVMEAMASGLKPVIHYFPGVETFYPKEYIYYDLNDFIRIMMKDNYDSKDYRKYIEDNYSLSKQIGDIRSLVKSININNQSLINIKSKNKNMKISYLMPVYNGENFIKKSLDSILNQKIKPFEIIVIDDNSTDNSYKILKDYSKKYPNIKLIRNKDNLGEAKNTANLINIARGDFIKILHQDDWLYEDYSTVISNIDNIDEFSFVINDFTYIINNNVINNYLKKAWDSFNINPNELKKEELQKVLVILGNYLGGPSNILFNRKKLLNINYLEEFDSNGGYARDYYTFIKLISINKPLFIFLDLSYRYEHTENATSKYIASLKRVSGLHKILKKFEHILNEDEKEIAYKNLFGRAIYSIDNCKDKQEKEKMIQYVLKNYKYLPREQEVELVKKLDFN
jgi:glycosyltransferase involved in cell wall biosynthesis